jgi:hypothetical protein
MSRDYPRPHHPLQSELAATLETGQKVKRRVPRMRACDELNAKGKPCLGHLKRWYEAPQDATRQFGSEIYRCERCHTLYLPNAAETPRTGTLSW